MIVWCSECATAPLQVHEDPGFDGPPPMCYGCSDPLSAYLRRQLAEAIRRPIDVEALLGPYHAPEYFANTTTSPWVVYVDKPWKLIRIEYNTVDLVALNYERWRRKLSF